MELDNDVLYELMLRSDDPVTFCSGNKYLHNLCKQKWFWDKKYLRDFGEIVDITPEKLRQYYKSYGTVTKGILSDNNIVSVINSSLTHVKKILMVDYEGPGQYKLFMLDHNSDLYNMNYDGDCELVMSNVSDISSFYILTRDEKLYRLTTQEEIKLNFIPRNILEDVIIDDQNQSWVSIGYPERFRKLNFNATRIFGNHFIDQDNNVYEDVNGYRIKIVDRKFKAKETTPIAYIDMDDHLILTDGHYKRIDTNYLCRHVYWPGPYSGILFIDMNYDLFCLSDDVTTFIASEILSVQFIQNDIVVIGMKSMN